MSPSRSGRRGRTWHWKNSALGASMLFTLIACGGGGSDSGLFSAEQDGAGGGAVTGTLGAGSGGAPFEGGLDPRGSLRARSPAAFGGLAPLA